MKDIEVNERLTESKARHNNGNLRDIAIVVATASVLIYTQAESSILLGFAVLAIGTLLHFLVKGVLVLNSVVCKDGIGDDLKSCSCFCRCRWMSQPGWCCD